MKDDASSSTAYVIARSTLYLGGDARFGHLLPTRAVEMSGWFVRAHSRSTYWLLTTMRSLSRPVVAMVAAAWGPDLGPFLRKTLPHLSSKKVAQSLQNQTQGYAR